MAWYYSTSVAEDAFELGMGNNLSMAEHYNIAKGIGSTQKVVLTLHDHANTQMIIYRRLYNKLSDRYKVWIYNKR